MTNPRPTILIVEDHEDSRMMYAEYLRMSFDVLEAADGQRAWEILQQTPPSVVVTDLALPRVDGYELIDRIRRDERLRDLPVVALSGYSARDRSPAGRTATWDVELLKPCLPEQLLEAIAGLASGRKSRG
jgi:two-component system, cell cycle response regulator DivK